MIIFSKDNQ